MIEQIIGKSKEIYGLFLGWDSDARAVMPQTNWSFHPISSNCEKEHPSGRKTTSSAAVVSPLQTESAVLVEEEG
jgi:hypothetical protein